MKISLNDKEVDALSVEVEVPDLSDYPKFCDAYISFAQFVGGGELSSDELEELQDKEPGLMYDLALQEACNHH